MLTLDQSGLRPLWPTFFTFSIYLAKHGLREEDKGFEIDMHLFKVFVLLFFVLVYQLYRIETTSS